MDKPLCRLCEKKHLLSEPHIWPKDAIPELEARIVELEAEVDALTSKADKRRRYHREYMSKRRGR